MTPLPPEEIGIPRAVLFRIPIEGAKEFLAMLPKKEAQLVIAQANARRISPGQYLADLIKRDLGN
jgi:hypothetical protein